MTDRLLVLLLVAASGCGRTDYADAAADAGTDADAGAGAAADAGADAAADASADAAADAGADAAADAAGTVNCQAVPCATGSVCCRIRTPPLGFSCVPAASCQSYDVIACDGPEDCGGNLCCVGVGGFGAGTACGPSADSCPPGGEWNYIPLCQTVNDCPAGKGYNACCFYQDAYKILSYARGCGMAPCPQ